MQQLRFRYFNDAVQCLPGGIHANCVACGRTEPDFGFVVLRDDGCDEYDVCALCLRSGALKPLGIAVNHPDVDQLRRAVAGLMPEQTTGDQETYVAERTEEVAYRTPRPAIQNVFVWPVHCGDYLVFFRRVSPADIDALSLDGGGRAFLEEHFDGEGEERNLETVDAIYDEAPNGSSYLYLWQCAMCRRYVVTCEIE